MDNYLFLTNFNSIFIYFSEDEEEEDLLYTDAYEGMKLRSKSRHGSGDSGDNNGSIARKADEEDPLKWIKENIPELKNNIFSDSGMFSLIHFNGTYLSALWVILLLFPLLQLELWQLLLYNFIPL